MNRINNNSLLRSTLWLLSLFFSVSAYAGTPTFSIAFSPTTIGPGGVSTLTYTIDNSAQSDGVSGLTFSNTLPTGMTVANPANSVTTCTDGTYSATSGSNSIAFNDYRLSKNASCTFKVNVTSATAGSHNNTTGDLSTSVGTVSGPSATLTVDASRPGFTMAFSPATITPGAVSTMTYTIDNSANGSKADLMTFTNTLPTGLIISTAPSVVNTCTGGALPTPVTVAAAGTDSVTVQYGHVAAGATCTISINVTASITGTYTNTTGILSQNGSNPSGTATATLNVQQSFLYAAFPTSAAPGSLIKLTFTMNNLDRTNAATDITFTNDLNATLSGLTATALPSNGFCGSGSTLTGSSNLTIAGANLAAEASCTFEVTVQVPANAAAGSYTNNTSIVNLTRGSATTEPAVSNTLVIKKAPTVTALFIDDPVQPGQDVTLRYTITNTDTTNGASAIAFNEFIDGIIPGVTIKTLPPANSCGSGSTFVSGYDGTKRWVQVEKGVLVAGGNCTFDVILTIPANATPGIWAFTTTLPTATVNNETVYGVAATDNLVIVAAPALTMAIVESAANAGNTVTAQFTLNYSNNATADATATGFTVDLNAGLSGLTSTTATQSDICGSGSSFGGTSTLTLSGATLSPGTSCTFSVTLQVPSVTTPGTYTITSSAVSATTSGTSVTTGTASDTLLISGLTLSMLWVNDPALAGGSITLRYTVANAASAPAATAIEFTHQYSLTMSQLAATALPSVPCGTGSTISGTTNLSVSGGNLQPGESCTFDVTMSIPANASAGAYLSATESMSATVNGNNTSTNPASDILTIETLTVLLTTTASSPTSTTPIPVAVNFSRNVTGLAAASFAIGNGTAGNLSGSGQSYTLDITPTSDGAVTIDLPANAATDAIDTSVKNPAATQLSVTYASTPATLTPTMAIAAPSAGQATTGPITYAVTYTNAVEINLTTAHITLNKTGTANATVGVTGGSTATPTVTLSSISGEGTLGFTISAESARNGTESAAASSPSTTFAVDNVKPTVAITDTVPSAVSVPFTATFTFSESVSGFTISDITATNATLSEFTTITSGTVYTAKVTPTTEGTVTLDIAANTVTDGFGNGNATATQHSIIYDITSPNVVISGPSGPVNAPFTATFTFGQAVTGFSSADITANNGSISNFNATSTTIYTATVTPASDAAVTLNVAASAAIDTAGNNSLAAVQYSVTYDSTKPTVVISSPSPSVNGPFTATFTFNEDVSNFALADISVGNASISNFATTSAKVYTATVTPASEGSVTIDVAADGAADAATNGNSAASQYTVTYDKTSPTLAITGPNGHVTEKFQATFTFNENVTGFALADISVGNGSASNLVSTNAKVYTADIIPSSEGAVTVDVAASKAIDAATNGNTAASQYSITYDKVPTLTISGPSVHVTGKFTVTINFSENVSGFVLADITANNATISNFVTTSAKIYSADITPVSEGSVTVDVAASVAVDSVSNNNTAAPQYITTYDKVPSVVISGPSGHVTDKFTATITFSENVTGFVLADITAGNASLDNFTTTSQSVYTVDVTPTNEAAVTLDVAAGMVIDSVFNNNTAATQYSIVYDKVPTVAISGPSAHVTGLFTATITFNENVSSFVLADITAANASLSNFVTTSASVYKVDVTPTKEAAVTLDVAAAVAVDSISNPNTAATQYSVNYDKVPTLAISGPSGHVAGLFTVTFTFNEPVTGFVLADITVGNGSADNFVATSSTVYKADITPTAEAAVTVDVAASVAIDSVSNPNAAASQYSITYDKVPTVAITGPSGHTTGKFSATATFNENVSDFVLADITIGNGSADNFVAVRGTEYTFDVTPTNEGSVTIDVPASVAIDSVSNPNNAATQFIINYDKVPTVEITGPSGHVFEKFTATITFNEKVSGFEVADITAGNATLANFAATSDAIYTVEVTPTNEGTTTLDIPASVAIDGVSNPNTAASQYSITYDKVPTVTISGPAGPVKTKFTATITFNEDVTEFVLADITVSNGSADNFVATSATVYKADITPVSDATVTVDVAAGTALDSRSNPNTAATQYSVLYDATVPTVNISGISGPTNAKFTTTFTFNEDVTGFELADVVLSNASADNFVITNAKTYQADITPTTDGTVTVDVPSSAAIDAAGNGNSAASQFSLSYDKTQPTLSISGPTTPVNTKFTALFTFSEAVSGFVITDISPNNATIDNFVTTDNKTYKADITPTSEGAVTVDVAAGVASDTATNTNTVATQYNITYDKTLPTLAITGTSGPVNAKFAATFTFNEDVTGFALADISASNATVDNFVGTNGSKTYTADITPTTDGTVTVDVAAGAAIDSATNGNSAATQYSVTYDKTEPTVTITGVSGPVNDKVTATFTFNEDVTGFVIGDITVGNATVGNFVIDSASVYKADITPTTEGTVTVDVAAGIANDSATNGNSVATQYSFIYDKTEPTLAVTGPSGPVNAKFTAIFTFNEDMTGFTLGDITVGNGSADNFVTTDAKIYKADITPTADGEVTVDVAASVAIDSATNANTAATQYTVAHDKTVPTLTIVGPSSPVNSKFTATFTFSEAVTGFAVDDISVTNAGVDNFVANSTTSYVADITPTTDGTITVNVATGAAQDSATNDNSAATQYSVNYDKTNPTLAISGPAGPVNAKFTATFTFSEDVTGFALAQINVSNGSADNFVTDSASVYKADITPSADGAVTVNVPASVATDSATNANTAASQYSVNYDATKPTVAITGPVGPLNTSFTATVTFNKVMTGFDVTDIAAANATLSDFAPSGTQAYTVKVTPTADGQVTLDVAADAAQDSATNGNAAATQYSMTYDITQPSLVITGPTAAVSAAFTATFTFSEDMTGFTIADIVVGNGAASTFAATSAKVYTALITPTADGNVTVDVAAAVAIDTSSNNNTVATQFVVEYDSQKPAVTITGATGPLNTSFTATFTFSKAVIDFTQSNITFANAGLSNFVSTSAQVYTVLVTPTTDGAVTLSLAAGVVHDAPGNSNTASNNFTLTYDKTNPTITSLSPAKSEVDVAVQPSLVITFNETVTAGNSNNLIEIKDLTSNAVLQSYAADSSAVVINDKVATITLSSILPEATEHYVTIGTNAFIDTATNVFAGISDNTTWPFKVINLPPLTVADSTIVSEDNSVIIDVLDNDNGDNSAINPASLLVKTAPGNGSTTVNPATGMITYTTNANFNGTDTFTYIVADMLGTFSAETTVTVTASPVNDAPVAVNDVVSVALNNTTTISVLSNDNDVDGSGGSNRATNAASNATLSSNLNSDINNSTLTITTQPKNGEITVANGTITYQPNPDFSGSDIISYTVMDNNGAVSNVASVIINVTGSNSIPTALADSASTTEDTAVTVNVLDNDSDSDGQLVVTSIILIEYPANGSVTINTDGTLTYLPQANYFGSDSFSYVVKDNEDAVSGVATVSVNVSSVNDIPSAVNDTVVLADKTSTIWLNVTGNDSDVDGTIATLTLLTQPQNATVTLDSATMLLQLAPSTGFTGESSFTYQLTDNLGAQSSAATVTLTQTTVNVSPLINSDTVQVDEDRFIEIEVLANDSDIDGRVIPVSLQITTAPTNGSASVKLSDGSIFYTPTANYTGQDSFVYQVSDNDGASGSATVFIQVNNVNDVPVANSQSLSTNEDTAVALTVSGSDQDNDNITYQIDSYPNNGTLSGTLPNLSYLPDANFYGDDAFKFVVNDGAVDSATATITVTVNAINDIPVASSQTITLAEDSATAITLAATDADGDTLTYTVQTTTVNGQLSGSGANLTYTPNTDFSGSDSFTFVANDGTINSPAATVTFTVSPVNDAPTANAQSIVLIEDRTADIILSGSDTESGTLSYNIQRSPLHGELSGSGANITYTPTTNYNGNDSFTFVTNDGELNSAITTISLSITAENDKPEAISQSLVTSEDFPVAITLSATDVDGDSLTYVNITNPANGVLSGQAPDLIYTPNSNFNGSDSINFAANDGTHNSVAATIEIQITAQNDLPIASDDNHDQIGWASANIDVLANDSDPEGGTLSIIGATASVGSVSFSSTVLTYTPINGFVGSTIINYTISDNQGATDTARVMVTITEAGGSNLATITVPPDIEINANGLLTKVDLGVATALDSEGNSIAVALVDDTTFFKPGINTVYWQAIDSNGLTTTASQTVTVHPLISLDSDQITLEGYAATVGVKLNGLSPAYPVTIPYTVSGTAEGGTDHDLNDGVVIIESGTQGNITFNLLADESFEGTETLIISLDETLNLGQQSDHTVTFHEENVNPRINLKVTQANQQNIVVSREEGFVHISADISHPDSNNRYSYEWYSIEQQMTNISPEQDSFEFDPLELAAGIYHVELIVEDIDDSQMRVSKQVTIKVEETATVLGTDDSDNDGVADMVEGTGDSDNDGIANYLDAITACNVMPASQVSNESHLVESESGVCLRLGDMALNRNNGGVRIDETPEQAQARTKIAGDHQGSIFDLVVDNLPIAGQSYTIVQPQLQPLPANAIYRLQIATDWWTDFVENADNQLMSSPGEAGYCPPPGDEKWQTGLTEGHWCVQIQLNDGGPNDADNKINGTIVTTGRVVVLFVNSQPTAQDDESQTRANTPLTLDVLANDSDNDGDTLTISSANAMFGTVSIIDNQLYYQPATELVGLDTIVYGISDGQGGSSSATLSINVLANAAPSARSDSTTNRQGQSIVIDVLGNDSDPEGDILSVMAAIADNGTVAITQDNRLAYKPNTGFSGTDNIEYLISDGHGGQATGLVSVTVTAIVTTSPASTSNSASSSSSGGGSMMWMLLICLGVGLRRRCAM